MIDSLLETTKLLKEIAERYAKEAYGESGTHWGGIEINVREETFRFHINYCTPGIGQNISLPLSMLKDSSSIGEIVAKRKEEERLRREALICKECGHNKEHMQLIGSQGLQLGPYQI